MFRSAWLYGNAKINFDSFFLAANETNFFVKTMKIRNQNHPPKLDPKNEFDMKFSLSND